VLVRQLQYGEPGGTGDRQRLRRFAVHELGAKLEWDR
jgi:hypothetical protein